VSHDALCGAGLDPWRLLSAALIVELDHMTIAREVYATLSIPLCLKVRTMLAIRVLERG
jgi:hypothetical protein